MRISDGGGGGRRIPKPAPRPIPIGTKGSGKARLEFIRAGTTPQGGSPGTTIGMRGTKKAKAVPAVYKRDQYDPPKKKTVWI